MSLDDGKEPLGFAAGGQWNGTIKANGSMHSQGTDRPRPDDVTTIPGTLRRIERGPSGKAKKESHGRSQSRHHHHQDLKTVGEYALHHLFNSFVRQADEKIHQCVGEGTKAEPRVESICGPGVDLSFDQLISALGHIARQKPKPLIDTLMFWRKAKSEEANNAKYDLTQGVPQLPGNGLPRRNTEPPNSANNTGEPNQSIAATIARQHTVLLTERRSVVSVYILCRVLMEIIGQSNLECITPEMADRLEDIIFTQLKAGDPDVLEASPLKHANWVIYGQLLGVMSYINFESVTRRFLVDLEKYQTQLSVKGVANRETESRAVLVIQGMRYLKIRMDTDAAWEKSCEFMQSLARLFVDVHGQPVKYAYCQLVKDLLLSVTLASNAQLSLPKWRGFLETIRPRVNLLLSKPKHWQDAYPLMGAIFCVSPHEIFNAQWLSFVMSSQSRFKERSSRAIALRSICRVVWVYLYRNYPEQPQIAIKKLDEVMRLVSQPGKRSYLSTESTIAEPVIQLIRVIGFRHQDFCFRSIIFPLMNSDQILSGKDMKVDNLEPERIVIGIRSFLAIMADLENGEPPPFPTNFETDPYLAPPDNLSISSHPRPMVRPSGKSTLIKEERLSRPVLVSGFAEAARESYVKFCKILGEITIICDNTFGGQAVLDEKFSIPTPKTPMADAFSFARRDDHQNSLDLRQGFYDLLHVAVQALPRCVSPHIPFSSLVNLLCTGTAHVQNNIAASSAQSIKSIAKQSHAQQVTMGFARFIFNFDDRYATMSDGGMLGPGHIESTLNLYVELLEIWIEEIKQKSKKAALENVEDGFLQKRGAQLDFSGAFAYVDEIESHGLFFLCSPSKRVRSFAVTVLRLITEFDAAIGQKANESRIIRTMEGSPLNIMDINDEKLTLAERSRLQKGVGKGNIQSTLIELCSSDMPYDSALWFKVFPNLIRTCSETCPGAIIMTRDIVCQRLSQMHRTVATLAEGSRPSPYPSADTAPGKFAARLASTAPEIVIEQWKLYLIFACTTMTNVGGQVNPQHTRQSSKSSQKSVHKVHSADELFSKVLPFLQVSNPAIRSAAVTGLGSINVNLYYPLLEALSSQASSCSEDAKLRATNHQRTTSSPRRNRRADFLRTEITHVYKLTSHFLRLSNVYSNDKILENLVKYTKELHLFLSDAEVQNEWDYQKLRTHYCGLVEELFKGVHRTQDPFRWMSFQSRKASFALMEDWCGYSPNQIQLRQKEDIMKRSMLDREDQGNKAITTATMEIEKKDLRTSALSAMAALCDGPVSITTDQKLNLQFDVRRMLSWIDMIFEGPSDRTHAIGRRALKNLILHNREHTYLLDRSIDMCYLARSPKALESYFDVIAQVLTDNSDPAVPFWKILSAGLFTLGDGNNEVRMKSARLLRTLEERLQKNSKLQDLDISISDKTIAVYKLAQFDASLRLSKQHSHLAFHIFSQFSYYFKDLQPDHQRNMVAAMLPWVQTLELQLDPGTGGPTANSYMLLVNLCEITVRCGNALHNEIQALWQALATGPHGGNVQLILDFIIALCLEKREHNFVDFAKQIVVYLSSTPAGEKVVEYLLQQISPRSMLPPDKREISPPPQDNGSLPYMADLGTVLPTSNSSKQSAFSLGHLCLILLVDLMVSPVQLAKEHVPLLLTVVLILWDHYTPVVQDQSREMLVHLLHELVISRIEDSSMLAKKRGIEDFIEAIRRRDSTIVWSYDDNSGKNREDLSNKGIFESLNSVASRVVKIFSITYPGIAEDLGRMAVTWASSCAVRHLAYRSIQLFRCVLSTLDEQMLADLLARLSTTISDEDLDLVSFTIEVVATLQDIVTALDPPDLLKYPQLFWATIACLNTVHEAEYMESLILLEKLMDKLDLSSPTVYQTLTDNRPEQWEGQFDGIANLLYKGVRSSSSLDRTLHLLDRILRLPSNNLVGDDSRLAFTLFANMPRFIEFFGQERKNQSVNSSLETLMIVSDRQNSTRLVPILESFKGRRSRSAKDFVRQVVTAVQSNFFPDLEFRLLTFLLSLLTSKLPWVKINTMQILCEIIPEIDMKKHEIATKGPDLISPLLRLLQTEYCPQALEVLDHVMTITGTSTPLDRHHLRMSMAGSHSSRAFRKEYDKTQSLYGIPEESGWSIPMPAIHSVDTRMNIQTIAQLWSGKTDVATSTPKIEFRSEEFPFDSNGDYRNGPMRIEEVGGDGDIGDLLMKLDSLDDFFDDDATDTSTLVPNTPGTEMFTDSLDTRESIYDQQTLPILHKSLSRNASVASLQYSLADSIKVPRDPGIMTPTAFATPGLSPLPPGTGISNGRPGLHSRSITSPALNQRVSPQSTFLLDENEEVFSDDETSGGRTNAEKSFILETMIKPIAQGTRSGFRSGMRRLTGGSADPREREKARQVFRAELQKSPRVPRVPNVYLQQNPKSADP